MSARVGASGRVSVRMVVSDRVGASGVCVSVRARRRVRMRVRMSVG